MTTFAELAADGTVLRVIVIEAKELATGRWGKPENWVETFPAGGEKKNYAGIGYTFDAKLDAFIAPKPAPDAVLDAATCQWAVDAKAMK